MTDLRTTYMGIELKNPLIVGACSLTGDIEAVRKIESLGAAALVVKSLFEEQIQLERLVHDEDLVKYDNRYAEMLSFFPPMEHAGPTEHLQYVRQVCQSVDIPVFASLNAVNRETWVEYAILLAETGVRGLELNFYESPHDAKLSAEKIEAEQVAAITDIRNAVTIPISIKFSPFYTNPLNMIHRIDAIGVNGFVLFNRLFQPSIDIESQEHISQLNLSHRQDSRLPLRFTGLLHNKINADICAGTGIFDGGQIVQMILAGAAAVQAVSALYENGLPHITKMLAALQSWMESKGYKQLSDFRGKMNDENCKNPWVYTRAQYARLLMNPEEIVNNYPVM